MSCTVIDLVLRARDGTPVSTAAGRNTDFDPDLSWVLSSFVAPPGFYRLEFEMVWTGSDVPDAVLYLRWHVSEVNLLLLAGLFALAFAASVALFLFLRKRRRAPSG